MKPQTTLPLKAKSGSMAIQQQRSMIMSLAHVTTKDHGDIPRLGRPLGLCRHENAMPSWICLSLAMDSGEMFPPLTSCNIQETWFCTSPEQHGRSDSGKGGMGKQALRPHICNEVLGPEVMFASLLTICRSQES